MAEAPPGAPATTIAAREGGARGASRRVRGGWIDAGTLLLGVALLAAWMGPAAERPLTWDEVDYVVAARAGEWANLADRGAMGPLTFARFALAKARHGDAEAVADAAGYDERSSLLSLRHWHPPGGLLALAPAVALAGPERGARLSQFVWIVVLGALTLFVLRDVAPDRPVLRAGILGALLLDPLTRSSVLEAHVHVAGAAAFLLPLWAWLRCARDPLEARRMGELREAGRPGPPTSPMAGRAGALVLGLATGALWAFAVVGPLWTALWVAALLAHRDARDWLGRGRGALWALGGALAALLVLWPGAFTRASLVQTYALRLYAVLFQGGREWSGAAAALAGFARESPTLVLYAAVGLAALGRGLLRGRRDALGAGAATTAFLIVILPFGIIDRYLLPLLPLAAISAAALFAEGDPERRYPAAPEAEAAAAAHSLSPAARARRWAPAATAALVVVGWLAAAPLPYPDPERAARLWEEYARVDRLAAADEVLAEGGQIFRFYATRPAGIASVLVDYDGERLLRRRGVRYDTVSADARTRVVLQRRGGAEPPIFARLSALCRRRDWPTHVHFACGGLADETGG